MSVYQNARQLTGFNDARVQGLKSFRRAIVYTLALARVLGFLICMTFAERTATAEEYKLTNITGWSSSELASLPHFDRYVPIKPDGSSTDFVAVCGNGIDVTAGNRGALGSCVLSSSQTNITPWGTYYWSYWFWDGTDYHYYSGNVSQSTVRAMNVFGQIAGYSTISGYGDSSANYDSHAYLFDAHTGKMTDLTPAAHRADPRDINDLGEITGYWSDTSTGHPFRRSVSGDFTDFVFNEPFSHHISPSVINNHGHVAGMITIWKTPRIYHPFFSESGSAVVTLPYPSQASPDTGSIADINDHDIIVGEAHKASSPIETSAVRWSKNGDTWVAEDLNELLVDNFDFVLDRAKAINDAGHIIATGHADGGPDNTFNTHYFLLIPVEFPAPTVTSLPAHVSGANSATLRAKINPANLSTDVTFEYGPNTGYGNTFAYLNNVGTAPVLLDCAYTGLLPHTTYHYRVTATNASGTTVSQPRSFTTPWDWTSWATAQLGATNPHGDANHNGMPDLVDYASGGISQPTITTTSTQARLTFRRSLIAAGVMITVQVSDNLVNWQDGSTYSYGSASSSNTVTTELSRTPDGQDGEIVTVATDISNHAFMRLKVVTP
ncbi:MAG: hypothetical protein HKP20_02650 [Akkermansiaceae bacterium]|nr:hypothetical protein [Akkermansiaceae bacterium]